MLKEEELEHQGKGEHGRRYMGKRDEEQLTYRHGDERVKEEADKEKLFKRDVVDYRGL